MRTLMKTGVAITLLTGCLWAAGCAGAEKSTDEKKEREPFIITRAPEEPTGMRLATPDERVRSIQLYRGLGADQGQIPLEMEIQFPVLPPGDSQVLTLEFDLMEDQPRQLTAFFYHANAKWQRDLQPVEYLDIFHRENLQDATPSRGTDVRYVHYTYQFPNPTIQFTVSGNYILK